jgi:hypothetical protein
MLDMLGEGFLDPLLTTRPIEIHCTLTSGGWLDHNIFFFKKNHRSTSLLSPLSMGKVK